MIHIDVSFSFRYFVLAPISSNFAICRESDSRLSQTEAAWTSSTRERHHCDVDKRTTMKYYTTDALSWWEMWSGAYLCNMG